MGKRTRQYGLSELSYTMPDYHVPLSPSNTYHIFSRAVGNEKLFRSAENYRFFLARLVVYVLPVADLFTYSLLPNHFHLLLRIKEEHIIKDQFKQRKKIPFRDNVHSLPDFIMEQFSNWLNSYTKAYNKRFSRKGALFMDYLKRSRVEKESDFASFVFYIHKNAVHHSLCKQIGDWDYNGYRALLSEKPTHLLRDEMIGWFGSRKLFIDFHRQPINLKTDFPADL